MVYSSFVITVHATPLSFVPDNVHAQRNLQAPAGSVTLILGARIYGISECLHVNELHIDELVRTGNEGGFGVPQLGWIHTRSPE